MALRLFTCDAGHVWAFDPYPQGTRCMAATGQPGRQLINCIRELHVISYNSPEREAAELAAFLIGGSEALGGKPTK